MLQLVIGRASSGAGQPRPGTGRQVNTWRDETGRVLAYGYVAPEWSWIDWTGVAVFTFERASPVVTAWPVADVRPDAVLDVFERIIQPIILQAMGHQALHASGVSGPDGAILFCGVSGSGKSTLAYALGCEPGFAQIADDSMLIVVDGEEVGIRPLPFSSRLRATAREFFHHPGPAPNTLRVTHSCGAGPVTLKTVFVLSQAAEGPEQPEVVQLGRAAAFSALLTHAHCFDESSREATAAMVSIYLEIAGRVPVFSLTYRPDFEALPRLLSLITGAQALSAPRLRT